MKIEMAYRNGRVDVFDTMSFTAPSPLGKGNALTNFELRFDELGETGLWLAAHHYDADPSATEKCPGAGILRPTMSGFRKSCCSKRAFRP